MVAIAPSHHDVVVGLSPLIYADFTSLWIPCFSWVCAQSNIDALTTMVKMLNEQIKRQEQDLAGTHVDAAKSNLMALFFTDPDQLPGKDFL